MRAKMLMVLPIPDLISASCHREDWAKIKTIKDLKLDSIIIRAQATIN